MSCRLAPLIILVTLLAACGPGTFFPDALLDVDGDGFDPDQGDCDDRDPAIHPAYPEVCDGRDNDCDGLVDGDDPDIGDGDSDGVDACEDCDDAEPLRAPGFEELCDGLDTDCDGELLPDELDTDDDGAFACAGDCDDADPQVGPDAVEQCNGQDDDCDALVDEGLDTDFDGFTWCAGDCAPEEPLIYPGAPEGCDGLDTDCDATVPADELDVDGDGHLGCEGDCDDDDATTFPGAPELCNGVDDACAGLLGDPEVDGDGDGVPPCASDCDDADPDIHPGATEQCNGLDDDCDGATPAAEGDADGDGFSVCAGDCDDSVAGVSPAAVEVCNGVDDDCAGGVPADELDADGDGQAPCAGDCDDGVASVRPGVPELCDGVDTDCDGALPDDEADLDGDGQSTCAGDCDDVEPARLSGTVELCDGLDNDCDGQLPPEEQDADGDGEAPCAGDCDDGDAARSSSHLEACTGLDDDCDGAVDDADTDLPDGDGDGAGPCADCDDTEPSTAPGATEVCGDGVDNDCDEHVDEPSPGQVPPLVAAGGGEGAAEGRLELFEVSPTGGPTSLGASGEVFASGVSIAAVAADADGDGVYDLVQERLVAGSPNLDDVAGVRATCDGGTEIFAITGVELPGDHRIVAAADLDGDGDDDLLSVRFDGADEGELRAHLNDGFGAFTGVAAGALATPDLADRWTVGPRPLDHDGDGLPDLVECGWTPPDGSSLCLLHPGLGDGTFGAGGVVALLALPVDGLVQGDFDEDGSADLLVGLSDHGDPGALYLLGGTGSGGFGLPVEVADVVTGAEQGDGPAAGRGVAAVSDFDADGTLDVVVMISTGPGSADRQIVTLEGDGAGGLVVAAVEGFTSSNPEPVGRDWLAASPP